jgi:hypothetical protein
MKSKSYWVIVLSILIFSSCGDDNFNMPEEIKLAYNTLPKEIDFNFDVKPILSDKCFACHGPDSKKREGKFRLDIQEEAFQALGKSKSYHAIVPGKVSKSRVVSRILSNDPDEVMPTPASHLKLTIAEKATIIKWIEQGAKYDKHWSFKQPERKNLPSITHKKWPKNAIDYYVLATLEAKKIKPAAQATKETLIRRVSFDLCGLPPTLSEIDQYLADSSPNAYEKMVDRYMASKAYGERMAADWLDVARYTDSDGYLDDKHRDFSPWRDWVIKAFNENMSYKQFVTWQLAGDLVKNRTQESILATAFNRLHRRNSEAGIVYEEYRTEYVADRTLTLGKAFMGLTVECAKCHDHKYDPISQKDYFRMFGFFNSTNEFGSAVYGPDQTPGPALLLTTPKQEAIINFIKAKVSTSEAQLNKITANPNAVVNPEITLNNLSNQLNNSLIAHYPFEQIKEEVMVQKPTIVKKTDTKKKAEIGKKPEKKVETVLKSPEISDKTQPLTIREPNLKKGRKGNGLFLSEFTNVVLPEKLGWFEHTMPFSTSISIYPDTLYPEANIFSHAEEIRLGLKGYSLFLENNKLKFIIAHSWPQNAIHLVTKKPIAIRKWTDVTITYDGSGRADGVKIYTNGVLADVEVLGNRVYKSILYKYDIHTYGFKGVQLGVKDRIVTLKNGGLDEFKWFNKELSALEVLHLHDENKSRAAIANHQPIVAKHEALQRKIKSPFYNEVRQWRDSLTHFLDNIPEIMVMGDLPKARKTFVLNRGNYDAPTEEVQPAALEAVLPFDKTLPKNRLGLTQWLFDQKNPLTARVIVNRIWATHFGQGIVKSSDDFGSQGALPTHPALLDYLAVSFVASGWDIKKLHKEIMMSATYQQSSVIRPDLYEIDPSNDLLARGPSFRLSAEMIRDNALTVSGLLVNQIGGKSVYPYQPAGLWDELSEKIWRYPYLQTPGEGLYRRSIYTVWKRTSPPPSMLIFDAPDRSFCTVKRRTTSTPLQALVLLNDPQMIEAARVLSEKINKTENNTTNRLTTAFRTLLGRMPDEKEKMMLSAFYQQQKDKYNRRKADAIHYLEIGEFPRDKSLDPAETAALAFVINGIMNTSEGYTRN